MNFEDLDFLRKLRDALRNIPEDGRRPVRGEPRAVDDFKATELPEFVGGTDPEDYLEWERRMDRLFDLKNLDDKKRCKYAIRRLGKEASLWWEGVKAKRVHARKPKISSWESLKRKLRKRYVPTTYKLSTYRKSAEISILSPRINRDEVVERKLEQCIMNQGKDETQFQDDEKFLGENPFADDDDSCPEICSREEPLYDETPVYDEELPPEEVVFDEYQVNDELVVEPKKELMDLNQEKGFCISVMLDTESSQIHVVDHGAPKSVEAEEGSIHPIPNVIVHTTFDDGISELRTIPFKGEGYDTKMGHEFLLNSECDAVYHGCGAVVQARSLCSYILGFARSSHQVRMGKFARSSCKGFKFAWQFVRTKFAWNFVRTKFAWQFVPD